MKLKAVDADLTLGGDTFTGHLAQYCLEQLPGIAGKTYTLSSGMFWLAQGPLVCEKYVKGRLAQHCLMQLSAITEASRKLTTVLELTDMGNCTRMDDHHLAGRRQYSCVFTY